MEFATVYSVTLGELLGLCMVSVLLGCALMLVSVMMQGALRAYRAEQRALSTWTEEVRREQDARFQQWERERHETGKTMGRWA